MQFEGPAIAGPHHLREAVAGQQGVGGQLLAQFLGAGPRVRLAMHQPIGGVILHSPAGLGVVDLEGQRGGRFRDQRHSAANSRNAHGAGAGDADARTRRNTAEQPEGAGVGQAESLLFGGASGEHAPEAGQDRHAEPTHSLW